MDYMYSETYGLRVGIKMTVQQIEDLRGLAVKLLGDSDEAQAARAVVGMDSWDLRKLRDQADAALRQCADALKYESGRLADKAKQEE